MIAQLQPKFITPQAYLEWEEQQPIKYEYINGEVFAMTGGTLPHTSIALNLASALKNHLRGKGCKVFMADAKVGVSQNGPFHYPDVMVSCDSQDQIARQIIYHPCLIVEVLSPSTEGFDRGQKFRHYRQIESLKEYVLIEADRMNVECYRINEKGKWELTAYSLDATTIAVAKALWSLSPSTTLRINYVEMPTSTTLSDRKYPNHLGGCYTDGTELEIDFTSVDFRCPISLLYEDVVFPEDNPEDSAYL